MAASYLNALKICSDFPREKKLVSKLDLIIKKAKEKRYKSKKDLESDMRPFFHLSSKIKTNFYSWFTRPLDFVPQGMATMDNPKDVSVKKKKKSKKKNKLKEKKK